MKTLLEVYKNWQEKIIEVTRRFPDEDIEGPLLVSRTDKYNSSDKKVLIFGQQTNGWYCDYSNIEKQISGYLEFNMGEKYRSTPFWDFIRNIEKEINNTYYSSIWLNLNRFDMNAGRPTPQVEEIISELDPIIIEELAILNPDIVLFLVGPYYDNRINSIFKDAKYISSVGEERIFSQIKSKYLPEKTFRTYHPGYLRRSGLEESIFRKIVNSIKT